MGIHNAVGQDILKANLQPGDYVLWLFDAVNEKDFVLSRCTPFSLKVLIEHTIMPEHFLNCPYEELPDNFNDVGFLDANGFLYFREHLVVDLSKRERSVRVCIAQE